MTDETKKVLAKRNAMLRWANWSIGEFSAACYDLDFHKETGSRREYLLKKYGNFQHNPVGAMMELDMANFSRAYAAAFPEVPEDD